MPESSAGLTGIHAGCQCRQSTFAVFRCYGGKFTASGSAFLAEILGFCSLVNRNNSGAPAVLSLFFAVLFAENSELENPKPLQIRSLVRSIIRRTIAISRKHRFVNLITPDFASPEPRFLSAALREARVSRQQT